MRLRARVPRPARRPSAPFLGVVGGVLLGVAALGALSSVSGVPGAPGPRGGPGVLPACASGDVLPQVAALAGKLMHRPAAVDGVPRDRGIEDGRRTCSVGLRMGDDGSSRVADYRLYILEGTKGPLAGRTAISLAVEGFQASAKAAPSPAEKPPAAH